VSVHHPQMPLQSEEVTFHALADWADRGTLYAVLEPTDDPQLWDRLQALPPEHVSCLFANTERADYVAVAPYLAVVSRSLLDWLVHHERPNWGVFAVATAPFRDVREHVSELLFAELPDGKRYLFRFYDGRVLPAFLQTCLEPELTEFFGPLAGVVTVPARQGARGDIAYQFFSSAQAAPNTDTRPHNR
jgi:hypothetical protein